MYDRVWMIGLGWFFIHRRAPARSLLMKERKESEDKAGELLWSSLPAVCVANFFLGWPSFHGDQSIFVGLKILQRKVPYRERKKKQKF